MTLDNEQIEFDCPECKKKIAVTIGTLKRGKYACPGCRANIDSKQFQQEIEKVERAIKDFERSLSRTFKR